MRFWKPYMDPEAGEDHYLVRNWNWEAGESDGFAEFKVEYLSDALLQFIAGVVQRPELEWGVELYYNWCNEMPDDEEPSWCDPEVQGIVGWGGTSWEDEEFNKYHDKDNYPTLGQRVEAAYHDKFHRQLKRNKKDKDSDSNDR